MATMLSTGILVFSWFAALDSDSPHVVRLAGVTVSAATQFILLVFILVISRYREYVADYDAVRYTENPAAMESGLEKLLKYQETTHSQVSGMTAQAVSFTNSQPGFLAFLLSTHPPLEKRIDRVRRMR
jgi:heat shock protein HtpX